MKKVVIALIPVLLIVIVFIVFVAYKNIIVQKLLETGAERVLGLNIKINDLDVSPFATHIRIEGLTIDNPQGFEEKEMAYIPLIDIVCDPIEYLKNKRVHFYFFALNIERFNIVKNKIGKVNIKEIKTIEFKGLQTGKKPSFFIEILKFSLGEIYYTDHQSSYAGKQRRYSVGIKDAMFSNIDNPRDIVNLVILKILTHTEIGKLIDMSVVSVAEDVKDIIMLTARTVQDTVKGLFGILSPFKILFQNTDNAGSGSRPQQ